MKNKNILYVLGGLAVAGMVYLAMAGGNGAIAGVSCINPNLPLAQHIHSRLVITVDGEAEAVPPDIGLESNCHRVLHTHEADGEIHVEANDNHDYTLGQFFEVWGKPFERSGYGLQVDVDGQAYTDNPAGIVLEDNQIIKLHYGLQPD